MNRFLTLPRLAALFLTTFAVLVVGVVLFQQFWVAPGQRCEQSGRWWDPDARICAQPLSIAEITGRPNGVSRAQASDEKNRELLRIEGELAEKRRARDADAEVQRRRLAESR
jgi:hypothetical protein